MKPALSWQPVSDCNVKITMDCIIVFAEEQDKINDVASPLSNNEISNDVAHAML